MAFLGEERGTRCEFLKLDKQTAIFMLLDSRGNIKSLLYKTCHSARYQCGNDKVLYIRYQMI